MPLLNIAGYEWQQAKNYFDKNPTKTKMKKNLYAKHSFIKVGNELYALANAQCIEEAKPARLGEGGFGNVKVVQTQSGENFALKIEGRGLRGENDTELKIMKMLRFVVGEAEQDVPQKKFKGEFTTKKLYTIMKLKEGEELLKILYTPEFDKKNLNYTQKLLIAIKSAQAILELHNRGIIHADIKPQNFMAKMDGTRILISSIDFGFSMLLENNNKIIFDSPKGTMGYAAPEILSRGEFSFASDTYALGVMFRDNLDLNHDLNLCARMTRDAPDERINMQDVMEYLLNRLKEIPNPDSEILLAINQAEGIIHEPDFRDALTTVKTPHQLLMALQNYPFELRNLNGSLIDKTKVINTIKIYLGDPQKVNSIIEKLKDPIATENMMAELSELGITSNYGLRNVFLNMVKVKHQENLSKPKQPEHIIKPQVMPVDEVQSTKEQRELRDVRAKITAAVNELETTLRLYHNRPNLKNRMQDLINGRISEILMLCNVGSEKDRLPPDKKWLQENRSTVEAWLKIDVLTPDVKNQIEHALYPAMPKQEKQYPKQEDKNAEDSLRFELANVKHPDQFLTIIHSYEFDIKNINGAIIDKNYLYYIMKSLLDDPKKVQLAIEKLQSTIDRDEFIAKLSGYGITSNYGLRDVFIKMIQVKYQENLAYEQGLKNIKFREDLSKSSNVEQFLEIVRNVPFELKNTHNQFLDKNNVYHVMASLLDNPEKVSLAVEKLESATEKDQFIAKLSEYGITSNYGLREAFIRMIKVRHQQDLLQEELMIEKSFELDLLKVFDTDKFLEIVLNVPFELKNKEGKHLDQNTIHSIMKSLLDSPEKVNMAVEKLESPADRDGFIAKLSEYGITSNYGLRDAFIKIIEIKHQKNLAYEEKLRITKFSEDLAQASSVEKFLEIVHDASFEMKNANGILLDKNMIYNTMKFLLDNPNNVNIIIEKLQSPSTINEIHAKLSEYGITSNYGLRDAFLKIVQLKHQYYLKIKQEADESDMVIEDEQIAASNILRQNLKKVKNGEQLLKLIREYPYSFKISDQNSINSNIMHNILKLLLEDTRKINSMAKKLKSINTQSEVVSELEGLGITENYGLQDAVIRIVNKSHQQKLSKENMSRSKPITSHLTAVKRKSAEKNHEFNENKSSKLKPT